MRAVVLEVARVEGTALAAGFVVCSQPSSWIAELGSFVNGDQRMKGERHANPVSKFFLRHDGGPRFQVRLLNDAVGVGSVGPDWVRIWVRSARPGAHVVRLKLRATGADWVTTRFEVPSEPRFDQTASVRCCRHGDTEGLRPAAAYEYEVVRVQDQQLVGSGAFETAPASESTTPDHFAFLVVSCHQPFATTGHIIPESLSMLRALEGVVTDHDVKATLMIGDQMYSDYPNTLSLFNDAYFRSVAPKGRSSIFECSRDEVRALYHQRYRVFGNVGPWRRLQALSPCYMMHDDHEVFDNFGALPEHRSQRYRALFEGALDASFDYQGLRHFERAAERPAAMHHSFEYGPFACFIMDLRSQKCAEDGHVEFYGHQQFEDLSSFLATHRDKPILAVVLTVPLVYVLDSLATVGDYVAGSGTDLVDRWAHSRAQRSRDRMLSLLKRHQTQNPAQKLILLGGDVHVGVVTDLRWVDSDLKATQMISSGVSNVEGVLTRAVAKVVPLLSDGIVVGGEGALVESTLRKGQGHNPVGHLNAGLVSIAREPDGWGLRLQLLGHTQDAEPRARIVYDSGPI